MRCHFLFLRVGELQEFGENYFPLFLSEDLLERVETAPVGESPTALSECVDPLGCLDDLQEGGEHRFGYGVDLELLDEGHVSYQFQESYSNVRVVLVLFYFAFRRKVVTLSVQLDLE